MGSATHQSRRHILRNAAVATAAASACALPTLAQGGRALRIGLLEKTLASASLAERLQASLSTLSGGTLGLEFVSSLDPKTTFAAVSAGALDGYLGQDHSWFEEDPAFCLFAGTPFGFTSREFEAWYHFGDGERWWDRLGDAFGIKPLYAGDWGTAPFGWFETVPDSVGAFRGLEMSCSGLGAVAMAAVGAVAKPGPDAAAAESQGLDTDQALGHPDRYQHLVAPAALRPHAAVTLGLNAALWQTLSVGVQEMLRVVAGSECDATIGMSAARDVDAFNRLLAEGRVRTLPEPVFTDIAGRANEAVRAAIADKSQVPQAFDAYQRYLDNVSNWTSISDSAYVTARATALGFQS